MPLSAKETDSVLGVGTRRASHSWVSTGTGNDDPEGSRQRQKKEEIHGKAKP